MECTITIDWSSTEILHTTYLILLGVMIVCITITVVVCNRTATPPIEQPKPPQLSSAEIQFNKWYDENKKWFNYSNVYRRWLPKDIWDNLPSPDDIGELNQHRDLASYQNHAEALACVREAFRRAILGKST